MSYLHLYSSISPSDPHSVVDSSTDSLMLLLVLVLLLLLLLSVGVVVAESVIPIDSNRFHSISTSIPIVDYEHEATVSHFPESRASSQIDSAAVRDDSERVGRDYANPLKTVLLAVLSDCEWMNDDCAIVMK